MPPDPLTRFETEHQEALDMLDRLEAAATALARDAADGRPLATARAAHAFLSSAVRAHNENEERALFPSLDAHLTAPFIEEHVRLRALEAELATALEAPDAARRVPGIAHELVALLRSHIEREDHMLFPHAREVLGHGGLEAVADRL